MKAIATHSAARNAPSAVSPGRDTSNIRLSGSCAVGKLDRDAASQPSCVLVSISIGSSSPYILVKFSAESSANGANPWPISLH